MIKKSLIILLLLFWAGTLFSQEKIRVAATTAISPEARYLIAPRWSPDGNYIAAAGENYGSIWLYSLKTKKWGKLVEQNGAGWDFDWSPDSKKIAYRANIFKNRRKQTIIKFVDISVGKSWPVTEYGRNFSTPKWISEDQVAFLQNDEFKTFGVVTKTRSRLQKKQPPQHVCLYSNQGIYSNALKSLAEIPEPLKGQTMNASYSHDGKSILFQKPGSKIFTYQPDSGTIKFITTGEMPAWSPDAKFIVFARPKDNGYKITYSELFTCDRTGQNLQQLTHTENELEMRPHWSPDGTKIACDSNGKIILIFLQNEVK